MSKIIIGWYHKPSNTGLCIKCFSEVQSIYEPPEEENPEEQSSPVKKNDFTPVYKESLKPEEFYSCNDCRERFPPYKKA